MSYEIDEGWLAIKHAGRDLRLQKTPEGLQMFEYNGYNFEPLADADAVARELALRIFLYVVPGDGGPWEASFLAQAAARPDAATRPAMAVAPSTVDDDDDDDFDLDDDDDDDDDDFDLDDDDDDFDDDDDDDDLDLDEVNPTTGEADYDLEDVAAMASTAQNTPQPQQGSQAGSITSGPLDWLVHELKVEGEENGEPILSYPRLGFRMAKHKINTNSVDRAVKEGEEKGVLVVERGGRSNSSWKVRLL